MPPDHPIPSNTVAILGASYGGARVAHLLAYGLPQDWTVVLIDRNTHINHLYVLPRYSVLSGHEHKAFIPYTNVFSPPPPPADSPNTPDSPPASPTSPKATTVLLNASVTSISTHSLTLDKAFPEHGISDSDHTLHFDFLVYALGSHLPAPINLWGPVPDEHADVLDVARGTKQGGIAWLKKFQKRVERASSVLVVGGGALGIQFATDIAEIYPATRVTLLHSRPRLLPRFDEGMHTEIISALSSLNVCTILGDRLDLSSLATPKHNNKSRGRERVVRTHSGREIAAELILLCTGQTPNTALLRDAFPASVIPDGPDKGLVRVRRTLQLAELVPVPVPVPVAGHADADAGGNADESKESSVSNGSNGATPEQTPASDEDDEGQPDPEVEADPEPKPESDPEPDPEAEVKEDPETRLAAAHIFAIGDAADAFGAVNAGHNAFFQGEVAARNIIALVRRRRRCRRRSARSDEGIAGTAGTAGEAEEETKAEAGESELEMYVPRAPAIKVSLGLTKCVYQFNGVIGTRDHEPADLDVHLLWRYFGFGYDRADLESDPKARGEAASVSGGASEAEA